jgi:hypothetical protein
LMSAHFLEFFIKSNLKSNKWVRIALPSSDICKTISKRTPVF